MLDQLEQATVKMEMAQSKLDLLKEAKSAQYEKKLTEAN